MECFGGPHYRIINTQLGHRSVRLVEATSRQARRRGLLGRDGLPEGCGLLLAERLVHMVGMRFALDLVWLRGGEVVRIDRDIQPGPRLRGCLRATRVLELPAGQAQCLDLRVGQNICSG